MNEQKDKTFVLERPTLDLFASTDVGLRPEHFGLADDGTAFVLALPFAQALNKRDAHDVLRLLDPDEWCPHIVRADGIEVGENVILEDGIWELIFVSRTPTAKAIKARVKAILRQLRETGVVDMRPDLSDPLVALEQASAQLSKSVALALAERRRAEVAEASVRVLMPAATAWETFCANGGTLSVSVAAKYLKQRHAAKTGRNLLYGLLRSWSWVFQKSCEPRGDAIEAGFVEIEDGGTFVPRGSTAKRNAGPKTRLTPAGLLRVAEHYGVTLDVDALTAYVNDEAEETAA